jgi:hypothetical protein
VRYHLTEDVGKYIFLLLLFTVYRHRQQAVSLSSCSYVSPVEGLLEREVVEGGEGAKLYDGEKAWYSINHAILSGN